MDDINILENQADILMQNVAGWENSVIEHIGNRIGKIGGMTPADVKMLNNIAAVTQDMDEIMKELAHVTGLNIAQIEEMYGNTLAEHHLKNNPIYDFRNKAFVPFAENKELQSLVRAYAKTTAGTMLNLSKTKGLCILNEYGRPIALKKYYNDILDKAVMQVASGATDFHTAMRQSITALGGSGVRVDYGGGITRRLDTVVRQTVLWGAKQAFNEYSDMIGEELGCDGIEIDYHRNPRPSHEFMQGKQYVLGKARKINGVYFESADEALERLEDYNCYHFKTPIICGISEPAYDEQELKRMREEDAKEYTIEGKSQNGYAWSQDMRKLETYMREQKRIKVAAQSSGDKMLVRKCNERIKAAQAKYEQISEVTGIRQDPSRFTIPREPRKINDVLTSKNRSGIINIENENGEHFTSSSKFFVKKGLTQSREFVSKIQSLTDDKNLQREFYQEIKEMLVHRSGTNGEDLKLYNPRLKKWYRSTKGIGKGYPAYNDEILTGIKEANRNELIAFHNHPEGMPPSAGDLNTALQNGYLKAYTIGHNGNIFEYSAPEYEIDIAMYESRISKHTGNNLSNFDAQIKALEDIKDLYNFTYREVLSNA